MTAVAGLGVMLPSLFAGAVISPAVAGGVGVATAALWGWSTWQGYRGKVNSAVYEDGLKVEQKQTPYYASASSARRTPTQTRVALTATGVLGEEIAPAHQQDLHPDGRRLEELQSYRQELDRLAQQRRLLADFGSESRYGKPVLHLVDTGLAARVLASGRPLHVVEKGYQSPLQTTTLKTASCSSIGHRIERSQLSFKEQNYQYELTEVRDPKQLRELTGEAGIQGVPHNLIGLYRDERSYTEVVERRLDILAMRREDTRSVDYLRRTFVKDNPPLENPTSDSLSLQDPSLKKATAIGAALGALVTASIPPLLLPGAAVGGLVGNSVARLLRGRQEPPPV